MSTIVEKTDNQGGFRVFTKGASEIVMKRYITLAINL